MNEYLYFENSSKRYVPTTEIKTPPLSYHYYKSVHQIDTFLNDK